MTMLGASVIYQFTGEQFKQLISEVKTTVIAELNQKGGSEKPLTREEAAAFLRIEPTTLDRRLRHDVLPKSLRHYNGGTLYFFASELEAYIKRKEYGKGT